MKRFTVSLLALALLTGLALAQGTGQTTDGQMQGTMPPGHMKGTMYGKGSHMYGGSMMYSMMVRNVITKANALNLTDAQKKEIAQLNDKYLEPLVQKENDFRGEHMKMMTMMQDPNFDPEALKSAIKTSNELNTDMADMMVDAMADARKTLGPEDFKQCMVMDWGMKSGTMQKGQMMEKNQSQ